ncbi:hypothetical protein RJ639_017799 [Escallonia herrerae]|uniref:Chromo domain-containing protein n=1 Tax=Escallonia herrerae TaxID=1293975 RepID=A0AA89AMB9_9ASTE|nr:hypothetical protein RJ639_017799 [Escallonia herrerae]
MMRKGNTYAPQVLIGWSNMSEDEATWEDWTTVKAKFPEFIRMEEENFKGGGNVMDTPPQAPKDQSKEIKGSAVANSCDH